MHMTVSSSAFVYELIDKNCSVECAVYCKFQNSKIVTKQIKIQMFENIYTVKQKEWQETYNQNI